MSLTSCLTNDPHPWMFHLLVLHEKVLTWITYVQNRGFCFGFCESHSYMPAFLLAFHGNLGPDLTLAFSVTVTCFCSLFCMRAMKANWTFITSRHIALSVTSTQLKILLDTLQQMFIHWKMHKQPSCQKGLMESILNTYTSAFQIKLI